MKEFFAYNTFLESVHKELDLKYLGEIQYEGKNTVSFFSDILRAKLNIRPFPYSDFKFYDELLSISGDIKYISAILNSLRPHINFPSKEGHQYLQTLPDRRYLMYASWGMQSIYNFWDRLGDIMHLYFETGAKDDQVYLARLLNNLHADIKSSTYFSQLIQLYESKIKPILDLRHDSVHTFQLEMKHYWGHIEFHKD